MERMWATVALFQVMGAGVMAAEPAAPPSGKVFVSGHTEISIHDLPPGSVDDLSKAVREYTSGSGNPRQQAAQRKQVMTANVTDAEIKKISAAPDHVYDIDDARFLGRVNPALKVSDYSYLKLKPLDLAITRSCTLKTTQANGLLRNGMNTGYSRYYQCPEGDVYTKDMLLEGVRKITIKEQQNVSFNGYSGMMHGYRDASGHGYTHLAWVSNNTSHVVERVGVTSDTRTWLVAYATELTRLELNGVGSK